MSEEVKLPSANPNFLARLAAKKDCGKEPLLEIDTAGEKAAEEVIIARLIELYPEYPNVGRRYNEQATGFMGTEKASIIQVERISISFNPLSCTILSLRLPKNVFYLDYANNILEFATQLGFVSDNRTIGYSPTDLPKENIMRISPNFSESDDETKVLAQVRPDVFLDKLEIKTRTEIARKDARIAKALELGVDCPG